jgi:hypothetical protein
MSAGPLKLSNLAQGRNYKYQVIMTPKVSGILLRFLWFKVNGIAQIRRLNFVSSIIAY